MKKTVYILGHKNPDTDSGVAAVAYARLKQLQGYTNYHAARAGHFAPQTEYIFKKFKVPYPKYIPDLIPKVQYFMSGECNSVNAERSVWEAIGIMEAKRTRSLPVVDNEGKYVSMLYYSIFAQNILDVMNPENKNPIPTSIELVTRTLKAQPVVTFNESETFKARVLVGSSSEERFAENLKEHSSENIIAITSDRKSIQKLCIENKVKLLIITSRHILSKELRDLAEKNGVSVVSSPHGTSNTTMMIAYSMRVSLMADEDIKPVHLSDSVSKIRPLIQTSPCRSLPVTDENNKVLGVLSEHDLLHEPNVELILVDHNEITQAVDGIENYKILEIIDHHRLGTLSTNYPITFINKPVGATATLITQLYQEAKVAIPKDIASMLLCAILSDTLILQSTTATEIDRQTAKYLSEITDLDIHQLGREIIAAGSRIEGRKATELIHQDMKEYTETKSAYTVSQIEVSNITEILDRKEEFISELEIERRSIKGIFSALLVTDITQLSSVLLICADSKFQPYITFPRLEENAYFLKDVVSRKKQLIPLITEQVENFER